MVFLWILSWIVFPATLGAAVIMAFWRGLRPGAASLRGAGRAVVILLLLCLWPRLVVAPQVRPYPAAEDVVLHYALVSAIGLGAALLAFGLGHAIRQRLHR